MSDSLARFMKLFAGSRRSYTTNVPTNEVRANGKKPGDTKVVRGAAGAAEYEAHLSGAKGLGIVPVCEDDTCTWGLIDIDDAYGDSGFLVKAAGDICAHGLPLIPCASKSGGVHAWLFTEQPVPAGLMRKRLSEMTKALGYPKTEIFPKQDSLDREGLGNAVNLPYFGGTRAAVCANGDVLSLEMFLDIAEGGVVAEDSVPRPSAEWFEEVQPTRIPLTRLREMILRKVAKDTARHVAGQQFFQQMHDNRFSRIEAEQASDEFVEAINDAESGSSAYSKNKAAQHIRWAWSKEARKPLVESKATKTSQTDVLLEMASDFEYFKCVPTNSRYVRVPVGDHYEVWPAGDHKGPSFYVLDALRQRYFKKFGTAPPREALNAAGDTILAQCGAVKESTEVYVRFARFRDVIWLDLCDEQWRAVKITAAGWEVVSKPEVLFRRGDGSMPLPVPVAGGSLDLLRPLLNYADEEQFILMISFMVGCFLPTGGFVHIALEGGKGTAKSSICSVLQRMTDPTKCERRPPPKDEDNAFITALSAGVMSYDNLSGCKASIADLFCRLSTGQGYSTRTLYANFGVSVASAKLPIILTGISSTVMRGDLLDRCITLKLSPIEDTKGAKMSEALFYDALDAIRPAALGALFDAVSCGLRKLPTTTLPQPPRMVDFATWLTACEEKLPWKLGEFIKVYRRGNTEANKELAENDAVGSAIMSWADKHLRPGMTLVLGAEEFLKQLNIETFETPKDMKWWPADSTALSNRLKHIGPVLLATGLVITKLKRTKTMRSRWEISRPGPQTVIKAVFETAVEEDEAA